MIRSNSHIGGVGAPTYDVYASSICQLHYCEKYGVLQLAPQNGICWHCGKNIYLPACAGTVNGKLTYTGIPVFRAGCTLITSCPHCGGIFQA